MTNISITRRTVLRLLGAGTTALAFTPSVLWADGPQTITKKIPSSGEAIPVMGMGTWRTFNVGADPDARENLLDVLRAFFDEGGGMIDSSPMYGSAQEILGYAFEQIGVPDSLFSADKIWTRDGGKTREQYAEIQTLWGIDTFDLMQVHNLLAWEEHLDALEDMKEEGSIRYVGITTSHGRRHREFEQVMRQGGLDFVQLTYNITHREVEERLLPLAADLGIAVIANRPYDGGDLVKGLKSRNAPLPEWAKEFDCRNWPDFLLKFIVSHPHVTCAIPATSQVPHMRENMAAGRGLLPDQAMRKRMIAHIESI